MIIKALVSGQYLCSLQATTFAKYFSNGLKRQKKQFNKNMSAVLSKPYPNDDLPFY